MFLAVQGQISRFHNLWTHSLQLGEYVRIVISKVVSTHRTGTHPFGNLYQQAMFVDSFHSWPGGLPWVCCNFPSPGFRWHFHTPKDQRLDGPGPSRIRVNFHLFVLQGCVVLGPQNDALKGLKEGFSDT